MKWLWIGICILLVGSFGVSDNSILTFDESDGDLSLYAEPSLRLQIMPNYGSAVENSNSESESPRSKGMPTEMHMTDKALLDTLFARIGETVYVRPTMDFIMAGEGYEQEPIKTILLAVYQGIEIGNNDEIISVGAVLLEKDMYSYTEDAIYILTSNPPIIPDPVTRYSYKLSDPHKIYIDKEDAYKKLLSIYEKRLKVRLRRTEQRELEMDNDRVRIERAIERMENKLK